MSPWVSVYNKILALGVIFFQIASLVLIKLFFLRPGARILDWCRRNAPHILFAVSLSAVLASLIYSEIIGFPPCKFCWWQRIFMYPQPIILLLAWKKARIAESLSIIMVFNLLGLLLSSYHIVVEIIGYSPLVPCDINPLEISCATRFVFEFGYISIPVMAFSIFLFSFLIAFVATRREIVRR